MADDLGDVQGVVKNDRVREQSVAAVTQRRSGASER
jgi:hypothetical protein